MTRSPRVIGIPYEEGTYWRKGAKFGPEAIRSELRKIRDFSLNSGKPIPWRVEDIDLGNMEINPYSKQESLDEIKRRFDELLQNNIAPLALGGDHSITLPIIRSFAKKYNKQHLHILHFDAHSDTFPAIEGYRYHHGAVFRNIIEEGLIAPHQIHQFGLRGFIQSGGANYGDLRKIDQTSVDEFRRQRFKFRPFHLPLDKKYYLSIDIDVVDPAFAPGTGTPVPGGLTSSEILSVVRQLTPYEIVGIDLVEVAPVFDCSNITSLLAAHLVSEMLSGVRF